VLATGIGSRGAARQISYILKIVVEIAKSCEGIFAIEKKEIARNA